MTHGIGRMGRFVLMVSHCAGMVDMVALPVWVGALIATYRLNPRQAGALVTTFLIGAALASLLFARRFTRFDNRHTASIGFGIAACAFIGASLTERVGALAGLHAIGGFAAGTALSFTHGTIGRSSNPHRLFGLVGTALGVFAIFFVGAATQLIDAFGGQALFRLIAGVMIVAAVLAAISFPRAYDHSQSIPVYRRAEGRLPIAVWVTVCGVSCLALVQAMVYGFVERIGIDNGFAINKVAAVLVAQGVINMLPPYIAVVTEGRLNARNVLVAGPILQAVFALCVTQSGDFVVFAPGVVAFVAVMLFTHTFAFGQLARMDPTGRAVAATPAMIMVGSAIGPVLGGTLVELMGYIGLGIAAILFDSLAILCFARISGRVAVTEPAH